MKWIEALKEYNAKHGGKYTIPRKGTAEYDAVRALMGPADAKVSMPKKEYLEEHKAVPHLARLSFGWSRLDWCELVRRPCGVSLDLLAAPRSHLLCRV